MSEKLTSRRRVLSGLGSAATLAIAAPFVITPRRAFAAGKLVLVSWGGTYRAAVEEALVQPFSKVFGVEVTVVDTPDLAKVKAQQMTGNVEWDVFDAIGSMAASGSKAGFWEPLDSSIVDAKDLRVPMHRDMAPFYFFTGGIGWDPKKFTEGKTPRNFSEYWDVKKYPGLRTFRNRASEALEAALIADGVPPRKLYPLDLDRAFKALDRIKPHVGKWVNESPEMLSLLDRGEVSYSYVYASRVKTQPAGKFAMSFDQTINGLEYLVVLKNAPNKANAMKFVQYAMHPERQAALMEKLGTMPSSRKAESLMTADARKWMPNLDSPNNAILDDDYWADKFDAVNRRFKEWVLA